MNRSTRNLYLGKCISIALVLLSAAFVASPAAAQYTRLGFGQFTHSRWTADDGAPTGIGAIAQTPDGWLWLGASDGLYRFDGITFERIAPPIGSPMERSGVLSLLVTRSGELWVGFAQNGGVGVFRSGKLRDMSLPEPPAMITSMTQTRDGAILATWDGGYNEKKVFRWQGGRWESSPDNFGLPDGFVGSFCATADGTRWAAAMRPAGTGLLTYLPADARRFKVSPYPVGPIGVCSIDQLGRLWVVDSSSVRLIVGADGKKIARPIVLPVAPGVSPTPVAFDRGGGLWQSSASSGVYYIPDADRLPRTVDDQMRHFSAVDGLTADDTFSVFIDRENTVWVGSNAGLDQFRAASVFREPALAGSPGAGYSIKRNGQEVYLSNSFGVFQISPAPARRVTLAGVGGICAGRTGGVWTIELSGYSHFINGTRQSFSPPPGKPLSGACGEDSSGRLWIITADRQIMWHDAGGWHVPERRLPTPQSANLLFLPWGELAYATGSELVRLNGTRATTINLAPFKPGTITKIEAGARDIFVGGSDALLRIRGTSVSRLDWRRFPWIAQLRMVLQTPHGDTWLRKGRILSRVDTADLERAFNDPNAPLRRDIYASDDGTSAPQESPYPGEQGAVASDGKVWLLNNNGPSFIDLGRINRNTQPPQIAIRSLASGGNVQLDPANLTLPAGTRALDITFAALTMIASKQVQFRYRLEGVDEDWIDPGNRRSASYTNLGPGKYRFRVRAANRDGVWNNTGATLEFEILPTFFESWPFYLLCAAAALALLWFAYSMRLRAVASRIRTRMNERLDERERIARELHDTLLQSVQGLIMRFNNIAQDIATIPPAHREMIDALDSADAIIIEGRDRVHALRQWSDARSLSDLVGRTAERLLRPERVDTHVVVEGSPRDVYPTVADELLRITDEALFNVVRHAQAPSVTIAIVFGTRALVLRIIDDGVGIAPAIVAQGGVAGHFGLIGMRERAAKIGGQLAITPRPDRGTQVEVTVRADIAYADRSRPIWLAWMRRFAVERSDG